MRLVLDQCGSFLRRTYHSRCLQCEVLRRLELFLVLFFQNVMPEARDDGEHTCEALRNRGGCSRGSSLKS